MRFFFSRSSVQSSIRKNRRQFHNVNTPVPCTPSNDRRGRHTAADLRAKRAAAVTSVTNAVYPIRSCGCDRFLVDVDYSDGCMVCKGCGLVFEHQILCPVVNNCTEAGTGSTRQLWNRPYEWTMDVAPLSAGYRRENHLAEVLKQATAMDPCIPIRDLELIHQNYIAEVNRAAEQGTGPRRYEVDIESLRSEHIKCLLVPLGPAKVKKYAERWLQIRRYIHWKELEVEEDRSKLLSYSTCERVHERYAIFVKGFEALRKAQHPVFRYRHNVPFLNTCITHILHQLDPELAKQQKWYFTDLETVASRLITEHRIALILRYLREHPEINGGYDWFYQCLLPEQDHQLYRDDPERFLSILRSQIKQCLCPPKRLRVSDQSQTPTHKQEPLSLTMEEQSWISSLEL